MGHKPERRRKPLIDQNHTRWDIPRMTAQAASNEGDVMHRRPGDPLLRGLGGPDRRPGNPFEDVWKGDEA